MRRRALLAAAVFASAAVVSADGGRLRVHEDAGPFRVAVFTRPEPLVAGPADVSLLVQDRKSGNAVLDADVTLVMSGPGGSSVSTPAGRHARNRLFYGARVELAPGTWIVEARVRRGPVSEVVSVRVDVGDGSAEAFSPWPYLAIPPLAIGLFAVNRRLRRRATMPVATALAIVSLWATTGCSYLKWRQDRSKGLSELKKQPSLVLEREVLPEDCYVLAGGPDYPDGEPPQVLAIALDHSHPSHELVGYREVTPDRRIFGILLPAGSYDLLYLVDVNHDGYYSTPEVVGRTDPEKPLRVDGPETTDGVIVPAPTIALDLESPQKAETPIHIKVNPNPMVVESVAASMFDPQYGELGVYQPTRFMAKMENVLFSVGEPDPKKVQVVLVHGIDGTPRDFATLIPSLDPKRYHVWLFYYPSGLPLDKLGKILALVLQKIAAAHPPDMRMAVVAHSMGGLVGRRALNELCRSGRKPDYLRVYVSFDTPYGGVEAAAGAVKRGTELVASWIDVAAGSPFLTRLHETDLPDDLPFYLFFGWGLSGHHGPSPAGDGTIALASQLDPRAQAVATGMSGYEETHVGILSDKAALEELSRILAESCARKDPGN